VEVCAQKTSFPSRRNGFGKNRVSGRFCAENEGVTARNGLFLGRKGGVYAWNIFLNG
jgi:hypothetical protein